VYRLQDACRDQREADRRISVFELLDTIAAAQSINEMSYRGRFAPSPTGPLHLGSMLTALASYIDARASQGSWLVRIEDLDPPRIQAGAEKAILQALEAHHLEPSEPIIRQSDRLDIYKQALQHLIETQEAFCCNCSRTDLRTRQALHHYDGFCRRHIPHKQANSAIRATGLHHYDGFCRRHIPHKQANSAIRATGSYSPGFNDFIQGAQASQEVSDFIIYRRDGLIAYQLAVVVDDHLQNISRVVRGMDLLHETPKQQLLQKKLNFPRLEYAHTPLILADDGQKLSKQTFAKAISVTKDNVRAQLLTLLKMLGQNPPKDLIYNEIDDIIGWATTNWRLEKVPNILSL